MSEKSDFWRISEKKLFFICLAIAAILWLFNALSQDYRYRVAYQLKYTNLPATQIPTIPLVEQVLLDCSGEGFQLLNTLFFNHKNAIVDYENFQNQTEIDSDRLAFFSSKDTRNSIQILNIDPPILPFSFQEKAAKKVPLTIDTNIVTAPLWFVSSLTLEPDSVTVRGPSGIIENVNSWVTAPIEYTDVDKNTTGSTPLISSNYFNLTIEPSEVKYRLTVDQWTEKQLKTSIIATGIEKDFEVFSLSSRSECSISSTFEFI